MNPTTDTLLDDALALFGRVATATISDAMDTLGVPAGCPGLGALVPGAATVGVAYTVQYAPVTGRVRRQGARLPRGGGRLA